MAPKDCRRLKIRRGIIETVPMSGKRRRGTRMTVMIGLSAGLMDGKRPRTSPGAAGKTE